MMTINDMDDLREPARIKMFASAFSESVAKFFYQEHIQ